MQLSASAASQRLPTAFAHWSPALFPTAHCYFEANSRHKISRGYFLTSLSLVDESFSSKWDLRMGQCNRSKLHLLFEYLISIRILSCSQRHQLWYSNISIIQILRCVYTTSFWYGGSWGWGGGSLLLILWNTRGQKGHWRA